MAVVEGAATIAGQATVTPGSERLTLSSVTVNGTSAVLTFATAEESVTVTGQATVTADGQRVVPSRVLLRGYGEILHRMVVLVGRSRVIPNPFVESTSLVEATASGALVLRWNQLLQITDLTLCLRDGNGPIHPVSVSYVMYYRRPDEDGSLRRAGPSIRYPVRASLGRFYATGRAGEFGQPGEWVIKWSFQRNHYDPVEHATHCFQVQDAVLRDCPCDITDRVSKTGWS